MAHLSDLLHQIHAYSGDWAMVEIDDDRRLKPALSDQMFVYVLLEGSVTIVSHAGAPLPLLPSNIATVFGDIAHHLEVGSPQTTTVFDYFTTSHDCDAPPLIGCGDKPAAARLLIGKIGISWPLVLRPAGLPPSFHIHPGQTEWSAAETITMFTRARTGPGASAYLTKVTELVLLRALRENIGLLQRLPPDNTAMRIARALTLVEASPGDDWTIARLAREVGMSRSSFAEKFAQCTGKRPMEAVTEARMRIAADLLEAEGRSIVDISARIGYRSEAAFSRRFERQFGCTPGRYRRHARQHLLDQAPPLP